METKLFTCSMQFIFSLRELINDERNEKIIKSNKIETFSS